MKPKLYTHRGPAQLRESLNHPKISLLTIEKANDVLTEGPKRSKYSIVNFFKLKIQLHKRFKPKVENVIKLGQLHKNQNLGSKDLSTIISEMRRKIKLREQIRKLKSFKADPEIVQTIRDHGYKESDIKRDLRSLNTPVSNLYQKLEVEKQREIEQEMIRQQEIAKRRKSKGKF